MKVLVTAPRQVCKSDFEHIIKSALGIFYGSHTPQFDILYANKDRCVVESKDWKKLVAAVSFVTPSFQGQFIALQCEKVFNKRYCYDQF